VRFVRSRRARRYVLRLSPDGTPRVTIPRGGSRSEAEAFLRRNTRWLKEQRRGWEAAARRRDVAWRVGALVLLRGERMRVEVVDARECLLRVGDQTFERRADEPAGEAVRRHLRAVAARELPPRVRALAGQIGRAVDRVIVRDQRSRWGSCSPAGTISVNWRLVQMPPPVTDYVIYHELAHLEHANHSSRFWRLVRRICPWTDEARAWLRRHGPDLL
jgi:predicted metal-dependent hydrolase